MHDQWDFLNVGEVIKSTSHTEKDLVLITFGEMSIKTKKHEEKCQPNVPNK